MACSGEVLPFEVAPARLCSGKCKSGGACNKSGVWVVAACEGMITLFEKTKDTIEFSVQAPMEAVLSLDSLRGNLELLEQSGRLDQLVLVGSTGDIAWLHMVLPPRIASRVVAEIAYPLMSGWFKDAPESGLPQLAKAISQVVVG